MEAEYGKLFENLTLEAKKSVTLYCLENQLFYHKLSQHILYLSFQNKKLSQHEIIAPKKTRISA